MSWNTDRRRAERRVEEVAVEVDRRDVVNVRREGEIPVPLSAWKEAWIEYHRRAAEEVA